jgi:group I intron endonuclease
MGQPLSQPVFIYRIICIPTGKCYIGMTQTTIRRRWLTHVRDAYKRRFAMPLHAAIRKYGEGNFQVAVCAAADTREEAAAIERQMIAELGGHGYNLAPGGDGGPTRLGRTNSPEMRANISAGQRGRKLSAEQIEGMSRLRKGVKLKPEHAAKVRLGGRNNKGKKHTEANRLAAQLSRREESLRRAPAASGAVGVYERRGKWGVRIKINGVRRRLGSFGTVEEAKEVYERAAREHLRQLQNTLPSEKVIAS